MNILFRLINIFIFTLAFVSVIGIFAENQKREPRAILSVIFWEKYNNESFSYAPWGNEIEKNATLINVTVGSSSLSRKFAYYGDGKLNFFNNQDFEELESEDDRTEKVSERKLIAEFDLPSSVGGTKEYLLLFLNKKKNGLWKIYPISFSEGDIPYGSYKFISQSRSNLYLNFGSEKVSLTPGKSVVQQAKKEEGSRGISLKAMVQKNRGFSEIYSRKFTHSPKMRGIFFLGLDQDKLNVKRIVDVSRPISSAFGYGLPRRNDTNQDEETNPE